MLAEAARRAGTPRVPPRLALVVAVIIALGFAALATLATVAGGPGLALLRPPPLDDFGPAPTFLLTDHLGRTVRSEDLRGRTVVANFVYTHCRETCPLLTARMGALQDRLRGAGLLDGRTQLLSFAVDPVRDTVPVLRAYAAQHHADPDAWRFLTGPEAQLRHLVVDGFRLGVVPVTLSAPVPDGHADHADHQHRHDYDVMHSNRFVLIDPRGHIRAYYDGLELDLDRVVAGIRSLLR